MVAKLPQRRRIRLDNAVYSEPDAVFSITICVKDREPVFGCAPFAEAAATVLRELAEQVAVPVYAWCIMPDHVHLVLGASVECDVVTFVGHFKSLTLRAAWQLGASGSFWQASFWDHAVRRDEQLDHVISYVLANPVRAGLVADPTMYTYCGLGIGAAGHKTPPYTK